MSNLAGIGVIIFLGLIILSNAIKILREYERGVIFRLGRLIGAKGPGIIFLDKQAFIQLLRRNFSLT